MDAADERLIETTIARLQPGDILFIRVDELRKEIDPGQVERAITGALEAVGLARQVACVLHDGSLTLEIIRPEDVCEDPRS